MRSPGFAGGYGVSAGGIERAYHEFGINWSTPRRERLDAGLRNLVKARRDDVVIVIPSSDDLGLTVRRSIHKGSNALALVEVDLVTFGHYNYEPRRSQFVSVTSISMASRVSPMRWFWSITSSLMVRYPAVASN
ncbi:MAG: hypothetical protein ABIJ61_07940 [bacterium]